MEIIMHPALTSSRRLGALLKRIAKGLCLPAAAMTLPLSAPSVAQSDPTSFVDKLRPRVWIGDAEERYSLDDRMADYGVPGVAVAIIDNGEVVFASGFGVRQSGATDPVDADTGF
jgi:CubicO group peptidase (beta-lactamase class C family)